MNTASPMESLTKEFHVDAVLSSDDAGRLDGDGGRCVLGEAMVRGKAAAMRIRSLK